MTHTISIRTISIFAAIIGIIAIALMAAYGNPAQGQSLPSVEFRGAPNVIEPEVAFSGERQPHGRTQPDPNQTVTVQYRTVDHHR